MGFIRIAFLILFILSTVITFSIRPKLHEPFVIEDANFRLVRISDNIVPQTTPTLVVNNPQEIQVSIPQTETVREVSQPVEVAAPKQVRNVEQTIVNIPSQTQKITQTVKEVPVEKTVVNKTVKNDKSQLEMLQRIMKNAEQASKETPVETKKVVTTQPSQKTTQTVTQTPVQKPVQAQVVQKPVTQQVQKPVTQTAQKPSNSKNPYMTEQEEIIAWNIWRSNIQNQIMRDSDIGFAPQGTVFTFSFVVDKFGNVSNIKVECSHPYFMDTAREGVKPAISKLQGKPILNFPKGTQRVTTTFTGNFVISNQNIFSTPGDFSDYERVKR